MKTVRFVLAFSLVAIIATGSAAQEKKKRQRSDLHPFSMAIIRFERTHTALMKIELTDEQNEQLKKLHESMNPKMKGVMDEATEIVGQEKMKLAGEIAKKAKEEGKTPRQVQLAIMKTLELPEEQLKKLEVMAKDMSKLYRGMMKEVNGMLTDEQKEALKKEMAPQRKGGKKKGK